MATAYDNSRYGQDDVLQSRLSKIAAKVGSDSTVRWLEIAAFMAFFAISLFTYLYFDGQDNRSAPLSPAFAAILLLANLIPATAILVLFGRRIALSRARIGGIESKQRLHVRLVIIFSLIAAIPTMLLVIFASVLFQSGVQFWFSGSARGMLENAGSLAKGYYEEKLRDVSDETSKMADDFRYMLGQTTPDDPAFLEAYVQHMLNRKLSKSAIVTFAEDGSEQTAAVISPNDKRKRAWISPVTLTRLKHGEKLVVTAAPDKIEATTLLFDQPLTYLYTNRSESVPSYLLGSKAQAVLDNYREMAERSRRLQLNFNITLYLVSLAIIGFTIWIALLVADRLVRPVTNLVEAAQQIADGDLTARVVEDPARSDEVAFLSINFNLMTQRLQSQTETLLNANRQLDDRRAFIEAILESVSAAVVSIGPDDEVRMANSTAENLLAKGGASIVGKCFFDVAPAIAELVKSGKEYSVMQLGDGPEPMTVAVKVAKREAGTVVTFEDISQQLADQRSAAWADVARRIAHEIKNPLTPIQLAAERLKRRFGKQVSEDEAVFGQLTDTIIRQVGDLRNIVDEFSSFARMPKPVFRSENLHDIVGHAVFLFEVAHSDIRFEFDQKDEAVIQLCDRRQLGQAITNILKNAVEFVQEKGSASHRKSKHFGVISTKIESIDGAVLIKITDNGMGLPEDRARLLEPYVTTRQKGSGLGLAIVKKIMEEHFGEIRFEDVAGGGAVVTLQLPTLSNEAIAVGASGKAPAIQTEKV